MAGNQRWMIFTDLDGTLLDRETYRFDPAIGVVKRIVAAGIPLIFCSSKTESEQRHYQHLLGIRSPFIIENGAAISFPEEDSGSGTEIDPGSKRVEFGIPARQIRESLGELRRATEASGIDFRILSQSPIDEVCRWTGLSAEAAGRARAREFSETLFAQFSREEVAIVRQFLARAGLQLVRGTRFYTVTSAKTDKGHAVRYLIDRYRRTIGQGEMVRTLAIGDGRNDLTMLRSVEVGILLCERADEWEEEALAGLEIVTGSGPQIWSEVVSEHVFGQTI